MKTTFLVTTPGRYWGKGKDGFEAASNAKKAGAKGTDKANLIIVFGDEGAYINEMGDICAKTLVNIVQIPISRLRALIVK